MAKLAHFTVVRLGEVPRPQRLVLPQAQRLVLWRAQRLLKRLHVAISINILWGKVKYSENCFDQDNHFRTEK